MNERKEQEQAGDPARAFEDLRSEVYVLRRAVEDWHDAAKKEPPPNYTEHLTKIGNALRHIVDQLKDIQKFPQDAAKSMLEAGNNMFSQARVRMDDAASQMRSEEMILRALVGTVRDRQQQKQWLIRAGLAGLVAGMILSYVLARALPLNVNTFIAAGIIGESRWDAGFALLRKSNPDGWQKLIADTNLVTSNREKIDACRAAAAKAKQDQSCIITISPDK